MTEIDSTIELTRTPLFEGLSVAALEEIRDQMSLLRFEPGDYICRSGQLGANLVLIRSGLAHVLVEKDGEVIPVARLRRGDVVGEMSLLTGEPCSATVRAIAPTEALQMSQEAFTLILGDHPTILGNLSRILSRRLALSNRRHGARGQRGEAVALILGAGMEPLAARIVSAMRNSCPGGVALVDLTGRVPAPKTNLDDPSVDGALAALDDLLSIHGRVLLLLDVTQPDLPFMLQHVDRTLLLGSERDVHALPAGWSGEGRRVEVILAGDRSERGLSRPGGALVRTIRSPHDERDVAWVGRHLARTRLGLALGAGGAKGFAHVGALHVLEQAGYTVDCVAGSSIGAMAGAWLAQGRTAAEVEETMRRAFTPETVEALFKLSFSGLSSGVDTMIRICRETTRDCRFDDLLMPLTVMTVDLNSRSPFPISEGPVWEALVAATSLAGMCPPYELDGRRLVDGLSLVPVPTQCAVETGADITLSVNLMSRDTLPSWPGQEPCPNARPSGSRMLDTLLEVMDLAQLDSSIRHAAEADVVVTPRFGPSSWRDFHCASLFLEAGRSAAEEQLPELLSLARPQFAGLVP
jgi:NTE family protein